MLLKTPWYVVFGALVLFTSPVRAGELETVRFGVVFSLSGDFESLGNIQLAGVRIRLEEFNRRAGEHGFRLEMLLRDDASSPAAAAAAFRELMAEGVVGILGSNSSTVTDALLPLASESGLALISPSATSNAIGRDYPGTFSVLFNDSFQGEALARFLGDTLNARRAAVIANRHYVYSQSFVEAFARQFTGAGGEIVASEYYDLTLAEGEEYDFLPILKKVAREQPEAIVLPGYAEEVTAVLRQSLAAGLRNVVFCGGDTWERESILKESGNNIANSYYVGYFDEKSPQTGMRHFMELLDSSNDLHAQPVSVLGYDALTFLIAGLREGRTREEVRKGLERVENLQLVSGPVTVDAKRGMRKPASIIKISRAGSDFSREVVDTIHPNGK